VLGEAVNEIVLTAMRFVGNDDNVALVRQQRMLPAFFMGKNF
jgi:fructose 1,6-bisphosphatase